MRRDHFQSWLSRVDALTKTQRAQEFFPGRGEAAVAVLELGVDKEQRCRDTTGSRGEARTFNTLDSLASTPLPCLRYRKWWLSFDESMAGGGTLKKAAERCGATKVLPGAASLKQALGVEALNLSAGERTRRALHIQMINGPHGQLKALLYRCQRGATRYLDSCLRRFHLIALDSDTSAVRLRRWASLPTHIANRAFA